MRVERTSLFYKRVCEHSLRKTFIMFALSRSVSLLGFDLAFGSRKEIQAVKFKFSLINYFFLDILNILYLIEKEAKSYIAI